jgi:hypothetical protein
MHGLSHTCVDSLLTLAIPGRPVGDLASARCHLRGILWLAVAMASIANAKDTPSAKRAFTVHDSIAWTHIVAPDEPSRSADAVGLFSPDGSRFVIHARRGDLERNANIETLLVYRTPEVVRYAGFMKGVLPPKATTLLEVPVVNDWEYLSNVRWLNDSDVGFISKGANGHMQAFSVNAYTKAVVQLTFSETDVVSVASRHDVMVYMARAPGRKPSQVTIVEHQSLSELLAGADDPDWLQAAPVETFVAIPGRPGPGKLQLPAMWIDPSLRRVWIAPSGNYAVLLAPAVSAPVHWAAYEVPDYERFGFSARRVSSDPTSIELGNRVRYMLVDLRTRQVRPLLDAPSGVITFNGTPLEVFWSHDERSVIVTNTYLPLNVPDQVAVAERRGRPALADVDVTTGEAAPIMWESVQTDAQRAAGQRQESRVVQVEWYDEVETVCAQKRQSADGATRTDCFKHNGAHWDKVQLPRRAGKRQKQLLVEKVEGLNERPAVRLSMGTGDQPLPDARERILLDPNPQAEDMTFGTTTVFTWKDGNGVEWVGGLLLPPNYRPGTRYPLVVQTHGFRRDRFLLDGPSSQATTAFAAQALANAGIVVLQVQDPPRAVTADQQEGPAAAEGYRAAIEQIIGDGIAEASKVGLIAFSRTGYHALHLLAKYPRLLSAVTISDALQAGYWQYVTVAANRTDAEISVSRLTGGAPEFGTIADWFARNPIYKLGGTSAAIRLEETGRTAGMGMWETYTILRRSGKPVELVLFPEGSHLLRKPSERLASQGGNVDWFRFWLQDYEDRAPEKEAQYVRWRAMRDARQLH